MAQEEIKYTIPNDGTPGARVDLIVTYNPTAPKNADGSVTITYATGTYQTLDAKGQVIDTDKITGLGDNKLQDQHLFLVKNPARMPIVDINGIDFTIDNKKDSNDGVGNINIFDANDLNSGSPPIDTPDYHENGADLESATFVTEAAVCFGSGALIRTARGDVAVEMLAVGDLAVTASGALRPIRWLGHRTMDCRRDPRSTRPIRIAAHAFAPNLPARDLRVSPGHAICIDAIDEVLIPSGALVNGMTIVQEAVDSVTYWHVELESHDLLLAESLPCESYLDMGNRGFFAEADAVALHGRPDAPPVTHADFCRPFVSDGPRLEAVRAMLGERARATANSGGPIGEEAKRRVSRPRQPRRGLLPIDLSA